MLPVHSMNRVVDTINQYFYQTYLREKKERIENEKKRIKGEKNRIKKFSPENKEEEENKFKLVD